MAMLEIPNLSEEVYHQIETPARVRGQSVSGVAADFLAKVLANDGEAEARLMAEVRAERDEMAKRGVWITGEDINEAKNRGRK